ncbi:trypsin-like serine peptidase [Roseibium aggregatum]|uniref:Trypsin-like peptidase domain-containing protein n=1 Tax=Roseibium aggregatum TaxID=187304 RepID=A0A939EF96_9HYPH|nr:serine protease [Roseibium aggregatum]MBN9672167.1 trypsin-like peptidase domain-containing protein [Roseibium aggregatum]
MKLNAEDLKKFGEACASYLHPGRLERFVLEARLVEDIETFKKRHLVGASDTKLTLAMAFAGLLNECEFACDVAEELYFEMSWSPDFQAAVGPHTRSARLGGKNHQALLQRRDHFLSDEKLASAVKELGPRVCCIVGEIDKRGVPATTSGTGFLVGPDLVLTSRHVVSEALRWRPDEDLKFCAVFDFTSGEVISDYGKLNSMAMVRVVKFHKDWHVVSSDAIDWDGTRDELSQQDIDDLRGKLDFALIRLAEAVGNRPVRPGYLSRRGWLSFEPVSPADYRNGSRIIMPQHPSGSPRKWDFGRICRLSPCNTRMVSEIESMQGTSGAPCLNSDLRVIGVHNAYYAPNGPAEGNQAIRFDAIAPLIRNMLGNSVLNGGRYRRAWRIDTADGALSPIFGREVLQDWINMSLTVEDRPLSRSERIYATEGRDPGCGKTFSTEILKSATSVQATNIVVVLGGDTELLPDRLEDFVTALAEAYGIPKGELENMPARPGTELPREADDGDKVDRWASHKMVLWFTALLEKHRQHTVNRTEQAKAALDLMGAGAPEEIRKLATAVPDVIERGNRWSRTWIALDDLNVRSMSSHVKSFVSGLVGADIMESSIRDVRKDIRWLFLGYVPDFLMNEEVTIEHLENTLPSSEAVKTVFSSAYEDCDFEITDEALSSQVDTLLANVELFLTRMQDETPETALSLCQELVSYKIRRDYEVQEHAL